MYTVNRQAIYWDPPDMQAQLELQIMPKSNAGTSRKLWTGKLYRTIQLWDDWGVHNSHK